MRYAVPLTDGILAAHFGHCEHFAIIDADEMQQKIIKKEVIASPGHEPGFLPAWLAEQGVAFVIAGGIGSRAITIFEENHIKVITGATEENPEIAVLNYIGGILETSGNVCDH